MRSAVLVLISTVVVQVAIDIIRLQYHHIWFPHQLFSEAHQGLYG